MVGPPTIFLSSYLLQGQAHGEDLKGPQPPLSSNSVVLLSQQVQGGWLSMDCPQSADTNLLPDGSPGQWWRSLGGLPKLPFASTGDWQALPATCFVQDTAQSQTNFISAFTRLEGVEERGLPRKPENLVPPLSSYGQTNRSPL